MPGSRKNRSALVDPPPPLLVLFSDQFLCFRIYTFLFYRPIRVDSGVSFRLFFALVRTRSAFCIKGTALMKAKVLLNLAYTASRETSLRQFALVPRFLLLANFYRVISRALLKPSFVPSLGKPL